jgi:microcystin-dependent protein
MTTAYSPLLGLALPVQGELSGTWGDTVNNYITSFLDSAVAGTQTLSTDADVTLTKTTGTALVGTSSQYAIINCTGARTALRTITAPAASKTYIVINGTTGGFGVKIVGAGPTTGITVASGTAAHITWNGSDFVVISANGITAIANGGTGVSTQPALQNVAGIYAGMMFDFAGTSAPSGYLLCDGSAVSRTTYASLFTALGGAASPWGLGDGSTTFNVPDLRRKVTIGSGGTAVSGPANTVGSTGGAETNTSVPSHSHTLSGAGYTSTVDINHYHTDSGHVHNMLQQGGQGSVNGAQDLMGSSASPYNTGSGNAAIGYMSGNNLHYHTLGGNTDAAGIAAVNNMPPSAVVTKIIKV